MILNKAQADAVYRAMCDLNSVSGSLSATIGGTRVEETHSGRVQVWTLETAHHPEMHANQGAFANAYGLVP